MAKRQTKLGRKKGKKKSFGNFCETSDMILFVLYFNQLHDCGPENNTMLISLKNLFETLVHVVINYRKGVYMCINKLLTR